MYGFFVICAYAFLYFFFKQKTAYEMRISDWSSDVCSSDLPQNNIRAFGTGIVDRGGSLVAVDRLEIGRLIAVFTLGVLEPGWTDLPYVVTNDQALDLDDTSAAVPQSLGHERSGDQSGQVDHPNSHQCILPAPFLLHGAPP